MQLQRENGGEGDSHFKFRQRSTIVQTTTADQKAQVRMTQTQVYGYHLLRSLLISGVLFASPLPAMAQRIPVADDTLGDERSIVSPDEVIRDVPSNRIDGGARRGANLFHSFREFNIDEGRGAYFTDPDGVANIITRVTGSSRSDILGTLGVLGSANLFLINPRGIVFGPNARLDIGDSFISSTADGFVFDNGFTFSATNPQAPPLLTVSVPIGLQYGSSPGAIQTQAASLQVPDGQTLTLAGGAVTVDGGGLLAQGGQVELGGVSAAGTIGLNGDGSLSFPDNVVRADISMTNAARVDVRAGGGGSITVTARNLEARAGSQLLAGIREGLGTPESQAGDVTISATSSVLFANESLAFNSVDSEGIGNTGAISISTHSLLVKDGAQIITGIFGNGDAGNLTVNATDVELIGTSADGQFASGLGTTVLPGGTGNGGILTINTQNLSVRDGAQISTGTFGNGDAGNLTITARSVELIGTAANGQSASALDVGVLPGGTGNGGILTINTQNLSVRDGAQITTVTFGNGDAGNLTITARNVELIGTAANGAFPSSLAGAVFSGATGNGGILTINTQNLSVRDGAQITTGTLGNGNVGVLNITATNIELIGIAPNGVAPSGLLSSVEAGGTGRGGTIMINAQNLSVRDGAQIAVGTFGDGDAGVLSITATDVELIGTSADVNFSSGLITATRPGSVGRGGELTVNADRLVVRDGAVISAASQGIGRSGNIRITTGSLSLSNGAQVSALTDGQGDAGNITITARDTVSFDGVDSDGIRSGASSEVGEGAIGQGGNIRITADSLSLTNGAQVSAATSGQGRAGNITFNTPRLLVSGNAQVLAETSSIGNGGSIVVNASESVNLRRTNNLSPVLSVETSGAGQAGDIIINTPRLTLAEQARITATATETATNPQSGGSITLNASHLNLAGIVGVFAETQGEAPAGTLRLNPYRNQPNLEITLTPRSQISASTSGSGNGGDLIVTAPESISITGAGRLAVETSSSGNAGNMRFTTEQLSLDDGVEISASTSGSGEAGDIGINAEELTLTGGSQVLTNTSSSGAAGDLSIQVSDRLFLTGEGTGLFATTAAGSIGDGGNITIDPNLVQLEEGATIAVDSQGRGTGGNIALQADQLVLDQGFITAETDSAQGGNISLDVAELTLLRDNSLISATAGTDRAGGDGGNISIDSPFIVAYPNENSDISANAFSGRGGNVQITAQSLFGIEARTQPSPLSDITASSQTGVAGVVSINTPDVDPNRGLVQLPADVADASRLIVQSCPAGNGSNRQQNEFIVTGRGGLPPTPDEAVHQDAIQVDLVTTEAEAESSASQNPLQEPEQHQPPVHPTLSAGGPIVEAQGWQVGADGRVMLVAVIPERAIGSAASERIIPSSNRQIHCR